MDNKVTCHQCGGTYKGKKSFSQHPCQQKVKVFPCSLCSLTFTRVDSRNKHQKTCLPEKSEQNRRCLEDGCDLRFRKISQMYKHLIADHFRNLKIDKKTFKDFSEFEKWKQEEDKNHFTNMHQQRGRRIVGDVTCIYFACNFEGAKERESTKKGAWKQGLTPALQCPARILGRIEKSGEVVVTYYKSHNHVCDERQLAHCRLFKSDLNAIKEKLIAGVEVPRIEEDCKADFGDREKRGTQRLEKSHLVTRKHIRDIRRNLFRGKADLASVSEKLEHLSKEKYNPVLVFKMAGEGKARIGSSNLDQFRDLVAIGLQTKEQLEFLKQAGRRVVCIDGTHGTCQYGYQLVNIIVPTKYGKGYPVGHFIVSRTGKDILVELFKLIKARFDEMKIEFRPNMIMTDDDQITGPAFREVFGEEVQHILCHWHVKQSWTRNLSKISTEDNRRSISQFLDEMLAEPTRSRFEDLKADFLRQFSEAEPCFVEYFREYYANRCNLWAMAFRNRYHAFTDTNMYCESFHNKLKTYYMQRKPKRRIDHLLDILLRAEKDAYVNHIRQRVQDDVPILPFLMEKSHSAGMKIPDEHVWQSDCGWYVLSQKSGKNRQGIRVAYLVKERDVACDCEDRCSHCEDLCPHMYKCGCAFAGSICKHVHKLAAVLKTEIQFDMSLSKTGEIHHLRQTSKPSLAEEKNCQFPIAEPSQFSDFPFTNDAEPLLPNQKFAKQKMFPQRKKKFQPEKKTPPEKKKTSTSSSSSLGTSFPLTGREEATRKKKRGARTSFLPKLAWTTVRHSSGMKIPDDHVFQCENGWCILSQTSKGKAYFVRERDVSCECEGRCSHCGDLCPHMYECGCDYIGSICKHLHKLSAMLKEGIQCEASFAEPEKGEFHLERSSDLLLASEERTPQIQSPDLLLPNEEKMSFSSSFSSYPSCPSSSSTTSSKRNSRKRKQVAQTLSKRPKTTPLSSTVEEDFSAPLIDDNDPRFGIVFQVGRHSLDIADVKSLEKPLKPWEASILKRRYPAKEFEEGRLSSAMIDAYIDVILVGSRTAAVTSRWWQDFRSNGNSFQLPFAVEDYDQILFPTNAMANLWVMYIFNVHQKSWEFLNPSSSLSVLGGSYSDILRHLHRIVTNTPNSDARVSSPARAVMEEGDENDSGVYVCFYARQSGRGEKCDAALDVPKGWSFGRTFRKEMYDQIAGKITA